ncbi:MAG TPA: hypothetical protein VNL17_14515 [Verrucomicrobiae bacterium]|nr:hypothetical protein [Verrucomicrobiae bacterium]
MNRGRGYEGINRAVGHKTGRPRETHPSVRNEPLKADETTMAGPARDPESWASDGYGFTEHGPTEWDSKSGDSQDDGNASMMMRSMPKKKPMRGMARKMSGLQR